jgi:hypothetical protein
LHDRDRSADADLAAGNEHVAVLQGHSEESLFCDPVERPPTTSTAPVCSSAAP